jgi:hypothetical protein
MATLVDNILIFLGNLGIHMPGMVAYICNLSTQKVKAGKGCIQGQSGLYCKILSQKKLFL